MSVAQERIFKLDFDFLGDLVSTGKRFKFENLRQAITTANQSMIDFILENSEIEFHISEYIGYIFWRGDIELTERYREDVETYIQVDAYTAITDFSGEYLEYIFETGLCSITDGQEFEWAISTGDLDTVKIIERFSGHVQFDDNFVKLMCLYVGSEEVWDYFYGDAEFDFQFFIDEIYSFHIIERNPNSEVPKMLKHIARNQKFTLYERQQIYTCGYYCPVIHELGLYRED